MGYIRSSFPGFESFFRIVAGLNADDNHFFSNQIISKFITYGIPPGIYSIKDNSETNYTMGGHEGTLQMEYDDFSMKTKIIFFLFWWNVWNLKV